MKKTITHKEKIIFPNGKKYVGEVKSGAVYRGYGIPHGHGTVTTPEGEKYVGEWKNGVCHGQGTFTFTDGSKDIGEFKDDEFIG
jgi:hypothetical protein|tara:strand:- start:119 stop:370 length:252 start_codon:yes stop_codon:yes gene_type:complete